MEVYKNKIKSQKICRIFIVDRISKVPSEEFWNYSAMQGVCEINWVGFPFS